MNKHHSEKNSLKRITKLEKELAAKNNELQIEAALDRVRAVAMEMNKPGDLLDVCKTLYEQFLLLGFSEMRNAMVNIHNDEDKSFINYDYSDEIGKSTNQLTYNIHPLIEKQIIRIRSANDAFSETYFSGEDLVEWKKFRKRIGEKNDPRLRKTKGLYYYFYSIGTGSIGISTFGPISKEKKVLLKRFRNVFNLSYQRYIDIAKAEAQAREAKIEAALERVRARSMAMHHSSELHLTADVLFQQLRIFGGDIMNAGIALCTEDADEDEYWLSSDSGLRPVISIPHTEDQIQKKLYEDWKNKSEFYSIAKKGAELRAHYNYMQSVPTLKPFFQEGPNWSFPKWQKWHAAYFSHGYLFMITLKPYEDEKILVRFAKVFEQAYTRFLDLQKAEAQAREAQIELGLERVRAAAMAMRRSEELTGICKVMYNELTALGFTNIRNAQIAINLNAYQSWLIFEYSDFGAINMKKVGVADGNVSPLLQEIATEIAKSKDALFQKHITGKEFEEWRTWRIKTDGLHDPRVTTARSMCFYLYAVESGLLGISTFDGISEQQVQTLKRFKNVFELSYRRYADVAQAEAQVRESQIQLALERVRARTMAMQYSDELKNAAALLFQQVKSLGAPAYSCGYNIWEKDDKEFTSWMSTQDGSEINGVPNIPLTEDANFTRYVKSKQNGEQFFVLELRGKRMQEHYRYLKTIPAFKTYFDYAVSVGFDLPETQIHHLANFSQGNLLFITLEPCPEFHDVFKRFAAVFEQTYTRFLDLQKAEAQARESQIQLALERVRARTMAMQHSDELSETAYILFQQFKNLGEDPIQITIGIFDEDEKVIQLNVTGLDGSGSRIHQLFKMDIDEPSLLNKIYEGWKEQKKSSVLELAGKELLDWIVYRNSVAQKYNMAVTTIAADDRRFITAGFFSKGFISFSKSELIPQQTTEILERFAGVFDSTYTRFLDLQKAEAQARESQIQLSLERVRARTMAMHKSEELAEVAEVLYNQLKDLGDDPERITIGIMSRDNKVITWWATDQGGSKLNIRFQATADEPTVMLKLYNSWKSKHASLVIDLTGLELSLWVKYCREVIGVTISEEILQDRRVQTAGFFSHGCVMITSPHYPDAETINILERFATVFDLTYRRFLDLQKAEAQTREAQIQLSLERVRARTMAMQKHEDLLDVLHLLVEQLIKLGVQLEVANFSNGIPNGDWDLWIEVVRDDGTTVNNYVHFPRIDHSYFHHVEKNIETFKSTGKDLFKDVFSKEDKDLWQEYVYTQTIYKDITTEKDWQYLYDKPGYAWSMILLKDTWVSICKYNNIPFSDEEDALFRRFVNAFGQAYTRFLDLQKAEAQAREAQIEAALERVRSRSLAMHKSDELNEVVTVLFEKLKELKIPVTAVGIQIYIPGSKDMNVYVCGENENGLVINNYRLPYFEHIISNDLNNAREKQMDFFVGNYSREEKNSFYKSVLEFSALHLPNDIKSLIFESPAYTISLAPVKNSMIAINDFEGKILSENETDIIKRCAKVFEQAYVRFLDLQKAEAQARESQIQLALERVRARTMAMQKSDELPEAANLLFQQMQSLGMPAWSAGYCIWDKDKKGITLWMSSEGVLQPPFKAPLTEDPSFIHMREAYERGETFYVDEIGGEELVRHYQYMRTLPVVGKILDSIIDAGHPLPTFQIFHLAYFSQGFLLFITYEPVPEAHNIFKRFGNVFDQTYTRFLDLQKAEAQARESQIQLALERVRARTMAMQKSDELPETSSMLFEQVKELGETALQNSIAIVDEEAGIVELSTTIHGSHVLHTLYVPIDDPYLMAKAVAAWKAKHKSLVLEFEGQELKEYNELRNSFLETKINFPEDRWIVNISFFSKGWLSFSSNKNVSGEIVDVQKRFAAVFDQTYTRFLDLQKAETQAREAQIEASLERVRASAMAMHRSDELSTVLAILFEQFDVLKIHPVDVHLDLFDLQKNTFSYRATGKEGKRVIAEQIVDLDSRLEWKELLEKWKHGKPNTVDFSYYPKEVITELMAFFPDIWAAMPEDAVMSPEDFPDGIFDALGYCKFGYIGFHHHRKATEEEQRILIRVANEFERLYQRFLDLQKAEAQTREAEIQLALERVRARSLAMHHTSELQEVANIVAEQLHSINIDNNGGLFITINDEVDKNAGIPLWASAGIADYVQKVVVPVLNKPIVICLKDAIRNGNNFLIEEYSKEEKIEFFSHLFNFAPWSAAAPERKQELLSREGGYTRSVAILKYTSIAIINHNGKKFNDDENEILKRFAKVFEQTYTRFLDLQKAETQAREAQIEAALERVRSSSLAMHQSEDIQHVVHELYTRLLELNIRLDSANILFFKEGSRDIECWTGSNITKYQQATFPYADHDFLKELNEAHENESELFKGWYTKEKKDALFKYLFEETELKLVPADRKKFVFSGHHHACSTALVQHVGVSLNRYFDGPFSAEEDSILKRFSRVFHQAYTRFLDLQKAEAQAKESQIQLALERVRARTMAMQKSDELTDVAGLLFEQVSALGIKTWTAGFNVWAEDNNSYVDFITSPQGGFIEPYTVYTNTAAALTDISNARKSGVEFEVLYTEGEKIKQLYLALTKLDEKQYEIMLQDGGRFPSHQYEHFVFGSKVSLMFITYEPVPEAHDIFKRLGKVFEQTYTRFLDLQKAEAQARESQIELGLERVRARAMAMQTSEELNPLIGTVFTELTKLDLLLTRCVILIYEGNEKGVRWWMANSEAPSTPMNFFVKYADMPFFNEYFDGWQNRSLKWQYCLEGENKIETDDFLFTKTELSLLPDFVIAGMRAPDRVYLNASFNNFGNLTLASLGPLSEEHFNILLRFAKVFDLTYTRFNDLQKAEAQAREAQIELALERVRARTMAMQKSDELAEAAQLLYHEFGTLGINTITCGYMFIDEEKNIQTAWTALPDGTLLPNFIDFPLTGDHVLNKRYEDWKQKKPLHIFEIQGEVNKEHHRFLSNYVPPFVVKDIFSQLPDKIVFHCANFSNGYLLILATDYFSPGDQQTIIRFAKVFEMTYRRFLDLEQAEAQAREAQIEAALERVRSKAMAMHNSADLSSAASVVFTELKRLGIKTIRSGISLQNKENRENLLYTSTSTETEDNLSLVGWAVLDDHPVLKEIYDSWVRGEDYFPVLKGDVLKSYYEKIKLTFKVPSAQSQDYEQYGYFMAFTQGMFYGWAEKPFDNNEKNILKRFASVVDLTFKRYFDLQKAESQAREAQFELALERVRARTMAMQKSDELCDAVLVIYEQLQQLNFESKACNIIIIDKKSGSAQYWVSGFSQEIFPESYTVPYFNHPYQDALLKPWKRGDKYVVYEYTGQIKKSFDEIFFTQTEFRNVPEDAKKVMVGLESVMLSTAFMSYGALQALGAEPLSEEKANILKRFAKVFEQTYTRFLDLQKAEAQAREAQIETSLERVRSKTMAMHSSDDVTSATATMFTELDRLGIENMRCGIAHYLEDHKMEVWSVSNLVDGKVVRGAGLLDTNSIPFWKIFYSTWRKKEDFLYYLMAGKEKEEYFKKISTLQNYLSQSIEDVPDLSIQTYYFPEGSVWAFSLKPHSEEDKQVMKRFASVFSLTFRRYQDLQKAEAQTREATIEAALEKVRGKAMAMHNSNDLSVTASLVFTELRKLGINPIRCGVGLLNKESQKAQLYSATSSADGDSLSLIGWVILAGHPVLEKIYETWLHNEEYYPQLQDEQLRSYYQLLLRGLPVTMPDIDAGKKQYGHFLPFSIGCLYAWSDHPHNESEIKILRRFATIIDLTFRRYLELQKAEANAREAVKQAAVDRIRADIASMRTIGDLDRITPLIWNELTILGIPFIRCGVFIMDDSQQLIHTFLSTPDGKAIAAFHLPYTTPGNIQKVISHWHDDKNYIDHWDESDFTQFAEMLVQQKALSSAKEYLRTIPHEGFYLHFLPFLQGMLYVGNTTQLGDEEIDLIQHVADAFSTAYARYEDFNKLEAAKQQVEKTLTDLKQAQTQLVQSEKMASLGELTAGIAHEIQNPLNFVNNFSEVSNELIDEMKEELARGNVEDAIAIAEDVKQNLEKINHHGKRADGIVKGMLQHSRTSSGQKEMTDINVLADEYLRLAYHGLRAKEKSFNAKFETDFDKSIEKINIIPQEIGRVILNLINNAFYAVSERKKHDQNGYEPTVILTTVKNNGKIEIEVKDNGNGIPQKVIDKIFQPFFTTKPTGQGTGLGLSLAYDIIKAHGGEIKVQTKEEEGSKFIIQLPA